MFWAPEDALTRLWSHGGFRVCVDHAGCTARVDFRHDLDALIARRPYGPLTPAEHAPVLTLQLPARLPGERRRARRNDHDV